jgi:hypothetical protein
MYNRLNSLWPPHTLSGLPRSYALSSTRLLLVHDQQGMDLFKHPKEAPQANQNEQYQIQQLGVGESPQVSASLLSGGRQRILYIIPNGVWGRAPPKALQKCSMLADVRARERPHMQRAALPSSQPRSLRRTAPSPGNHRCAQRSAGAVRGLGMLQPPLSELRN